MDFNVIPNGQVFVLINGVKYPCVSASLTMAINAIPKMSAMISLGTPLKGGGDIKSQEDLNVLIQQILSGRSQGWNSMVSCSFYDTYAEKGEAKKIFSGYIVAGSVVQQAYPETANYLQITCMNKICVLEASALGLFVNATVGRLAQSLNSLSIPDDAEVINSGLDSVQPDRRFLVATTLSQANIDINSWASKASLAEMVSTVVNIVMNACVYTHKGKTAEELLKDSTGITQMLFSRWRLNTEELSCSTWNAFIDNLCDHLVMAMSGQSIMQAMRSTLVTKDYMLNLIPRMTESYSGPYTGKTEICPAVGWEQPQYRVLKASDIRSIQSNYNPYSCLTTPNALIVYFSSFSAGANDSSSQQSMLFGKYAVNKQIQQALRSLYIPDAGGNAGSKVMTLADQMVRAHWEPAPKWLAFQPLKQPSAAQQAKASEPAINLRKLCGASVRPGSVEKAIQAGLKTIDKTYAVIEADKIAESMFAYLYGQQDGMSLKLNSGLRFGWRDGDMLEDHLGDVVDIEGAAGSGLNMRGVIDSITYNYGSSSNGSTATYTMNLSCVRPKDADNTPIHCSIYKRR